MTISTQTQEAGRQIRNSLLMLRSWRRAGGRADPATLGKVGGIYRAQHAALSASIARADGFAELLTPEVGQRVREVRALRRAVGMVLEELRALGWQEPT